MTALLHWYDSLDPLQQWFAILCAVLSSVGVVGAFIEAVMPPPSLPPPSRHTRRDWDQRANTIRFRGRA